MSKIIVALDFDDQKQALAFIQSVNPSLCKLKVGKAMFTRFGTDFVKMIIDKGFDVFLDLKFHDIPNQVAGACKAATDMGVWMVNVHASGGFAMMQAAKEAVSNSIKPPLLIAVTVLTSLEDNDLMEIGINRPVKDQVLKLALLASEAGLDGVVCSAAEAPLLKKSIDKPFCLVTPGIRPENSEAQDQRRIVTPAQAIENGADYLVIGRPITQAEDPVAVLSGISKTI